MNNLILPAIFYAFLFFYIICLHRNASFKVLHSNFEALKYYVGSAVFFALNINVVFFCSFCDHCHGACITFTMCAVLFGAFVYLAHLVKQTIAAIKKIISGDEFDLMAPFFSIPYFVLLQEISSAVVNSGFDTLHAYESKMIIVLLYPFFVAVGELNAKVKVAKTNANNGVNVADKK